jgi:cobalt-zinc-cadmium efflux system protein
MGWAFGIGIALNLGFVIVELVFGGVAHSLALVGDAAHNFSDVFALILAGVASILVRRRATLHYTYGFRRTSILAALANAVLLLIVTGGIGWEAIRRLAEPNPVGGGTVVAVAIVGIFINGTTALLFMRGHQHDLNVRGAFLHMASDALVSLGVVIAGAAILVTGWTWLDPVVSLLLSTFILYSTWGLLRESLDMALDAVPGGIDPTHVTGYLMGLPGVVSAHDLHIWAMSTTEFALTAHLVMRDPISDDTFLIDAGRGLHDTFGIEHITLQREVGERMQPCESCDPVEMAAR